MRGLFAVAERVANESFKEAADSPLEFKIVFVQILYDRPDAGEVQIER